MKSILIYVSTLQDRFWNVRRYYFYSKVTLHTDCCTALADHPTSYRSFVSILQKHQHKSVSILYTNLCKKFQVAVEFWLKGLLKSFY